MDLGDDTSGVPVTVPSEMKDPILDVGSYIWKCTNAACGVLACVAKAPHDHGCIDATPDELTNVAPVDSSNFQCPQCHREAETPMPYKISGYAVRQEFTFRNYNPLLAIFLSWSGFGQDYAGDIVRRTLQEQFRRVPSRLRIATRKLKANNNRPHAMSPDFEWLEGINYKGNVLIFIDTHSDTSTGNLVVSGNATNSNSLPVHELLQNYLGDNLRTASQHIANINAKLGAGPFVRGIIVSSCGSAGRVPESIARLKRLVEMNIFDFVFTFAGVYTVDSLVVPALSRFVENVYVYDMEIWDALQRSFGEDRRALNSSPVMLSFAEYHTSPNRPDARDRVVSTRVLAYANFKDARPWGLDMYQCFNPHCRASAHNMIFHADGRQFYGKKWLETRMRTKCLACGDMRRGIEAPSWVNQCGGDNNARVWFFWPLTMSQRMEIGITQ
ncbi:hypothetical protein CY34DRAFT_19482 [Suillus luteus UH-Slu-Lm8-n1]|uniref:Uncharacterized protein n=1 Tax=Suillus luteus UH-Slu-Lm8-n1 TaxID=930992 RepID=A0A0C9Z365_9AGAM|nr:hypothetical protein CY34DRAFT_19482 [Suillus luteus UH-Slu-Lm8-n1]